MAVVANPEFLQEGAAVKAFLEAERIVIGSDDPGTADRVAALYGGVDAQVHSIGLESAELAKYACNSFLSTKLSFVNSISALCELAGADVEEVVAVMGSDSRIGSQFLRPGPGWGGSCFPKDLAALAHNSAELGFGFPLLEAVVEANEATFARVVNHVAEVVGVLQGSQVAVWGLAFKAGTSDVRNSPALTICRRLIGLGARVVAFDPLVKEVEGIELASSMYEACEGADALVVLTEWEEFSRADLRQVAKAAPGAVVIDTRAVIGLAEAADAGLEVWRLGRPLGGGGTDVG